VGGASVTIRYRIDKPTLGTIRHRMARTIENTHERLMRASVPDLRAWLDRAWTGGADDVFPRDRLPSWREAGPAPRFGHARLRFQMQREDATGWEARFLAGRFEGHHGFELRPEGNNTRIRHTLRGRARGAVRWQWPLLFRPLHDWAAEALFDRLEVALKTGSVPDTTARPMSVHTRLAYRFLDLTEGGMLDGHHTHPRSWGTSTPDETVPMECDAVLRYPDHTLYRGVTIDAPATRVFPWLCQLRAAPYSYDWLDNYGRRSPRCLDSALGALTCGDRFMRIFRLVSFEADTSVTLVLDDRAASRWFGDLAVTYRLIPQSDPARTRLLCKLVIRYPRSTVGRAMRMVLPWGDLIMMRKQLLTLKTLAETWEPDPKTS